MLTRGMLNNCGMLFTGTSKTKSKVKTKPKGKKQKILKKQVKTEADNYFHANFKSVYGSALPKETWQLASTDTHKKVCHHMHDCSVCGLQWWISVS